MRYGNAVIHNVRDIFDYEGTDKNVLSRLPKHVFSQCPALREGPGYNACGVEIRFRIKRGKVKVTLEMLNDGIDGQGIALMEVFHGGFAEPSPCVLKKGERYTLEVSHEELNMEVLRAIHKKEKMAYDPDMVRIVLPYEAHISLIDIEGDIEPPMPGDAPSQTWWSYGSSITHGGCGLTTSGSYPFRVSSILGIDNYNLGFAGSAHLESEMAEFIAQAGVNNMWNILTLEMGINLIWNMENNCPADIGKFRDLVDHFVSVIAEANPNKPILCIDIFTTQGDYDGDGLTEKFRQVVRDKVARINRPNVFHIDGRKVLSNGTGLSSDVIHPSADGMENMGVNLARLLKGHLFFK